MTEAPEAHANLYFVEFSSDGGDTWEQLHISAPPLVLDGLAPDTTYLVRVAAAVRAGQRDLRWSDPVTVTTKAAGPPPLPAPTLSEVGVFGSGGVSVKWSEPQGSTGTRFTREPGGISIVVPPGTTEHDMDDIATGTRYHYQLNALGDGTTSGDSDPLPGTFTYLGPLHDPAEIDAVATSQTAINVTWEPVDHATKYLVNVQTATGSEVASVDRAVSPQAITGLNADTQYTATVYAWGQVQSSSADAVLSIESPGQRSATVTTLADGAVGLDWEPDPEVMLAIRATAVGADQVTLDFGDATDPVTVADGEEIVHTYASTGTYTVTASAPDRTGATETVVIKNHAPNIHVFVSPKDDWEALLWIDEADDESVYRVDWDDWSEPGQAVEVLETGHPRVPHQYTQDGYYIIRVTDAGTKRRSTVDFEAGRFGTAFAFKTDNATPTVTATAMAKGATWRLDWGDGSPVETGTIGNSGIMKVTRSQPLPNGTYKVKVAEVIDGVQRRTDQRELVIPWDMGGDLKVTVSWEKETADGLRPVTVKLVDATMDCAVDWGDGSPGETVANNVTLTHNYNGAPPVNGWLLKVTEPGAVPRRFERLVAEPTYVGQPTPAAWRWFGCDLHIAGVDDDRGLDAYRIIWGDSSFDQIGATGWWTNARHKYPNSGPYRVFIDGPGTARQVIRNFVMPRYPVPKMLVSEDRSDATRMSISISVKNPDCGGPVTLDFDDGSIGHAAETEVVTHQFAAPGEYTVVVSCDADPSASDSRTITVPFTAPGAYIDIDDEPDNISEQEDG